MICVCWGQFYTDLCRAVLRWTTAHSVSRWTLWNLGPYFRGLVEKALWASASISEKWGLCRDTVQISWGNGLIEPCTVACGRSLVYIGLNIIVNTARQSSMTRQALGEEVACLGRVALMLNFSQLRTYVNLKCMLEGETNHIAIAIIVARGGRLCSFVFFNSRWWDTLTLKRPSKGLEKWLSG